MVSTDATARQAEAVRKELQLLSNRHEKVSAWEVTSVEKVESTNELKNTNQVFGDKFEGSYDKLLLEHEAFWRKEKSLDETYELFKRLLKEQDW